MNFTNITSFEPLKRWLDENPNHFENLDKSTKDERQKFRNDVEQLKKKLHPINTKPEIQKNIDSYHNMENKNSEQAKMLQAHIKLDFGNLQSSSEMKEFNNLFGLIDRNLAEICNQDARGGRSNRAKRAKKASDIFRTKEQLSKAKTDNDGNKAENGGDLGVPGAFDGLKVTILKQYCGYEFPNEKMKNIVNDLNSKGFEVNIINSVTDQSLDIYLKDSNQFWLISNAKQDLTDSQINRIVEEWKNGMGIYVFGDNEPYYVDANRLLKEMGLPIMSGNYGANNYLSPFDERTSKGFVESLPMTGITSRLFEGITIAEFNKKDVMEKRCVPIMYNSRGGISVIMREAINGCGQVICDGAFTKLFCNYDAAGSKWLVVNSACFLAADFSDPIPMENNKNNTNKNNALELNMDEAFKGECDITFESEVPIALLASIRADPEEFTTDFILNDPLMFGNKSRRVFPGQQYKLDIAKTLLEFGRDPFTRKDLVAVIPVVSLKCDENRKIVLKLLADVYMNGLLLPKATWFLYLAANDAMMANNPEHKETLQYNIDQILDNITSTSDFTENYDEYGNQLPLIKAMEMFCTTMPDLVRIRKSFTTTSLMARILHSRKTVSPKILLEWTRQSLIKVIVNAALTCSKAKISDDRNKKWFDDIVESSFYTKNYGIPMRGTSKNTSLNDVLKWLIPDTGLESEIKRLLEVFDEKVILSDSQITTIMHILLQTPQNIASGFTVENYLGYLLTNKDFNVVWKGNEVDSINLLEERFKGFHEFKFNGFPLGKFPPPSFITPFGPSVYSAYGTKFGDPKETVTQHYAEEVKEKRNKYFRDKFNADIHGYPTRKENTKNGSSHYNLHRAIQNIMTSFEFKNDMELKEEHVEKVAKYLLDENKGYIYHSGIINDVKFTILSYLDCRKKGMREPLSGVHIDFYERMKEEQKVLIQNDDKMQNGGKVIDDNTWNIYSKISNY